MYFLVFCSGIKYFNIWAIIESRWGRDFSHTSRPALGPTQPPIYNRYRFYPGAKAAGAWCWQRRGWEWVELFFYSPSKPLVACYRVAFSFMFCRPCIKAYQYSETREIHFLSSLLHVSCETPILVQPADITRTQYTKCRLCGASWGWSSNARNM
jgi:hypothetical protein